jgi:hypothetical protein
MSHDNEIFSSKCDQSRATLTSKSKKHSSFAESRQCLRLCLLLCGGGVDVGDDPNRDLKLNKTRQIVNFICCGFNTC